MYFPHTGIMLDPEKLKKWLKDHGYTREWLAKEIGAQKRSLDNYFTAGEFPEWAEKHIHRIMTTPPVLRFSDAEFDRIERARIATGYTDRDSFYIDAINAYAQRVIDGLVTPFPTTYEVPAYTEARKIAEPATKPPPDNLKGKPA